MEELFNNIISNRIYNLLETINKTYPDKFNKTDIKKEHIILMQHIKLHKKEYELLKPITNEINDDKKNISTSGKAIKIKPIIQDINRCNGRVWNDYIRCIKTDKKIFNLEKEFIVNDFRQLNVDEFLKKYKIGNRCKNKKLPEGKYCYLHTEHLIHGDYLIKPSKEIIYHYINEAKFS